MLSVNTRTGASLDLTPGDQVRANIEDDLEDDADHVLISHNQRNPEVFDVYRVNIHTGQAERVADAVLARTPAPTTYARIDLVEFAGAPALMEAELIEPELFLGATAEAAMNFARVLGGLV